MMKSLMERGGRYWARPKFTWSQDLFLNVKAEDICGCLTIPTFFKARIRPRKRPRVHMTWYTVDPPCTMDWIQSKLLQTRKKMDDGTRLKYVTYFWKVESFFGKTTTWTRHNFERVSSIHKRVCLAWYVPICRVDGNCDCQVPWPSHWKQLTQLMATYL